MVGPQQQHRIAVRRQVANVIIPTFSRRPTDWPGCSGTATTGHPSPAAEPSATHCSRPLGAQARSLRPDGRSTRPNSGCTARSWVRVVGPLVSTGPPGHLHVRGPARRRCAHDLLEPAPPSRVPMPRKAQYRQTGTGTPVKLSRATKTLRVSYSRSWSSPDGEPTDTQRRCGPRAEADHVTPAWRAGG